MLFYYDIFISTWYDIGSLVQNLWRDKWCDARVSCHNLKVKASGNTSAKGDYVPVKGGVKKKGKQM